MMFCESDSAKKCFYGHLQLLNTGEQQFRCNVCQRAFSQKGHLENHMHTHTGDRPFKCEICSASFDLNSTLKLHKFTHTGVRPF